MKKDYKKIYKSLYQLKPNTPVVVSVPRMKYLMVHGEGLPNEENFQKGAQTLFPVAYIAKFIVKGRYSEEDFTVMPMEVKWKLNRTLHGSERYSWTMMIMQPEIVDLSIIDEALRTLKIKKKVLPYEGRLCLKHIDEGLCGQIIHIGPYGEPMDQTFRILTGSLEGMGYQHEPDSHDVYYNDARKSPPEKLKTMMRVRVWKMGEIAPDFEKKFHLDG